MYLDFIIIVSIMRVKFYLLMFKLIQSCVILLKPVWFKCMHFWSVALPWCWRTTGHSHAAWPRRYNTAARDQQTPIDPTLSRLLPSMTNHLSGQNIIKLLLWVVWHLTMSTCRRQGTITAKLFFCNKPPYIPAQGSVHAIQQKMIRVAKQTNKQNTPS